MAGLPETLRSERRAQRDSKTTLALKQPLLLALGFPLGLGEGFDAGDLARADFLQPRCYRLPRCQFP